MILRFLVLSLCVAISPVQAQLNIEFIGTLDYTPIVSSLWGYTAPDGTEYALVGHGQGLSIVSLADPTNPQELQMIPAVSSQWRELKTWGHFAYIVQDVGMQGMLIVDLSTLPQDTAAYLFWRPDIPGLGLFNKAHTIWIDEFGLAYLNGANLGGCMIVDVKPDPWNPQFLALMPLDYAHDVYARDSIVYSAEIIIGQMRIYDIANLDSILLLGSVSTPFTFTHNTWLSDDGNTAFTTDERANAFVTSYDVSDPANIKELDRFRPAATVGRGVVPHNVHVWDDFVIISYYTDGCIVLDASRPDNLIEVGNFDTFLGADGGFSGAWGAYPFLPSGKILISDRQNGLFVLGPTYVRGCFLEGSVRSSLTQIPISNVQIEILIEVEDTTEVLLPEYSDPSGEFKMGKAVPGIFMIRLSHPDYVTKFAAGMFQNGVVLELHVEMEPLPTQMVSGRVIDPALQVVPFAYVAVQGNGQLYQTQADALGLFSFPTVQQGSYQIYAGNWGQYSITNIDVFGVIAEDIVILDGYYDDFLNDLGWTVSGNSQGSHWERATPVSELLFNDLQCNPAEDVTDDFGSNAFVTGNAGGSAEDDDVEDGYTLLSSPAMDLTQFNAPALTFTPWLCERFTEEQVYFVLLSNGTDTVVIDTIITEMFEGAWQIPVEIELSDKMEITNDMQVHFLVQDISDTDNVIKAALDKVLVIDAMPSAVTENARLLSLINIYPNPADDVLHISVTSDSITPDRLVLFNTVGQRVHTVAINSGVVTLDVSHLVRGMYWIQVLQEGIVLGTVRVVLQ